MTDSPINTHGVLHRCPAMVRQFCLVLVITMTFGYTAGMVYLYKTTDMTPHGVEENYLGNETNEEAQTMKFKMSEKQVLNIVHSHVLSYATILFCLGLILIFSSVKPKVKRFFLIEPLLSLMLTFGGLWALWFGVPFMSKIVMVSGILLTLGFYGMVTVLIIDLAKSNS